MMTDSALLPQMSDNRANDRGADEYRTDQIASFPNINSINLLFKTEKMLVLIKCSCVL